MSAAATAAGYLFASGRLRRPDADRVVGAGEHGQLCPHCSERFAVQDFEFHLFIAHKLTEAKS